MAPSFVENLFAPVYKYQLITDVHKKYDSFLSALYGAHKYSNGKRVALLMVNIMVNIITTKL